MSKVIKVENKIYDELDQLRRRRETFSQVIENLLAIRDQARLIAEQLYPPTAAPDQLRPYSEPLTGAAPEEQP